MTDHEPRTVLITGASRGIGRALAELYLDAGATVFATARAMSPDGFHAGTGTLVPIAGDITRAEDRARIAGVIAGHGAPLDLIVNNAGIQLTLDLTTIPADVFAAQAEAEIGLNLLAPLVLTQMLLPLLRQPGGAVVNLTSLIARHPKPTAPVYSATKAGLASYTRALRQQLAPRGIRVVEAVPPLVDTEMTAGRGSGKLSASDMAAAIAEGVATGRTLIAPGKSRTVLMLNRIVPELVETIMRKS